MIPHHTAVTVERPHYNTHSHTVHIHKQWKDDEIENLQVSSQKMAGTPAGMKRSVSASRSRGNTSLQLAVGTTELSWWFTAQSTVTPSPMATSSRNEFLWRCLHSERGWGGGGGVHLLLLLIIRRKSLLLSIWPGCLDSQDNPAVSPLRTEGHFLCPEGFTCACCVSFSMLVLNFKTVPWRKHCSLQFCTTLRDHLHKPTQHYYTTIVWNWVISHALQS